MLVVYHRAGSVGEWQPGLSTAGMRKRLDKLSEVAAWLIRVGELGELAQQLRAVSPHQPRHGLGYQLRKRGVDLGVAQQLLGHARPAMTMRYGQPTEADVREALRRANGA